MFVVLTYDFEKERVAKALKICRKYLTWVQNSVFECELTEVQLAILKGIIGDIIDTEKDSVRIYYLHKNDTRRVEVIGKETAYNVADVMII